MHDIVHLKYFKKHKSRLLLKGYSFLVNKRRESSFFIKKANGVPTKIAIHFDVESKDRISPGVVILKNINSEIYVRQRPYLFDVLI